MRWLLALLFTIPVFGDAIAVGVRVGAPMLDAFSTAQSGFQSIPHHLTFGPTLELRLPLNFGVSFDILHTSLEYQSNLLGTVTNRQAGQWEFPLLLRYRFAAGPIKPFVSGGPTFNKITGLTVSNPVEFVKSSTSGITLGGGLDIKIPKLHLTPELRYTHHIDDNFSLPGFFSSQKNQFTFLVGVTF